MMTNHIQDHAVLRGNEVLDGEAESMKSSFTVDGVEPMCSLEDSAKEIEPESPSKALLWATNAMMVSALLTFFYEGLAYNLVFLGRVLPAAGKSALVVPLFVVFNALWGLSLWSYLQAHSRDPGVVPTHWDEFAREVGQALPIAPARPEWSPGKATFCKRCCKPRPDRAHHCRICGICVLRMDHHCPWINNCVGFNTQKFFLLLAIYADLACFVALVSALPELFFCLVAAMGTEPFIPWQEKGITAMEVAAFAVFGIVALIVGTFLAHMLSIHIPLAAYNCTSIEDFYENMDNPFDHGGPQSNLAEVFGDFGLDWFIPIKPLHPRSDGVSFARSHEISHAIAGDRLEGIEAESLWRLRYNIPEPSSRERGYGKDVSGFTPRFAMCGFSTRTASLLRQLGWQG